MGPEANRSLPTPRAHPKAPSGPKALLPRAPDTIWG